MIAGRKLSTSWGSFRKPAPGTFLCTILGRLGISIPGPLIGGHQENPGSSFLRTAISEIQENLLSALDRCWYSQQGVQDLPLGWRQHRSTVEATYRLLDLLQQEVAIQNGPWAINASGTSLLLPLWRKVAAELNLPLKLLLNVQQPSEALPSLLAKDLRAFGMNSWRSQQLCWRHTCQAVLDGQDLPLVVIHHCRWRAGRTAPEAADQAQKLAFFCEGSCLES